VSEKVSIDGLIPATLKPQGFIFIDNKRGMDQVEESTHSCIPLGLATLGMNRNGEAAADLSTRLSCWIWSKPATLPVRSVDEFGQKKLRVASLGENSLDLFPLSYSFA
jgi:hypothetical protein